MWLTCGEVKNETQAPGPLSYGTSKTTVHTRQMAQLHACWDVREGLVLLAEGTSAAVGGYSLRVSRTCGMATPLGQVVSASSTPRIFTVRSPGPRPPYIRQFCAGGTVCTRSTQAPKVVAEAPRRLTSYRPLQHRLYCSGSPTGTRPSRETAQSTVRSGLQQSGG